MCVTIMCTGELATMAHVGTLGRFARRVAVSGMADGVVLRRQARLVALCGEQAYRQAVPPLSRSLATCTAASSARAVPPSNGAGTPMPAATAATAAAAQFAPRDPAWHARVTRSFDRQTFMNHLGAEMTVRGPGQVDVTVTASPALRQQHGYFHAGVTTSIADSAAGYAAYTLFEADSEVLSTEIKINLLNPAVGDRCVPPS